MISIYKISIIHQKGAFYISYKDGFMKELLLEFDYPMIPDTFNEAFDLLPYEEKYIPNPTEFLKFEKLVPRTVQEKVVVFKMQYRGKFGVAYQAKKEEKANLKGVIVSPELLKTYFECNDYPLSVGKSMADYVKNYNFIRQITANGKPIKTGMPDVYDREYEKKLDPTKIGVYWQHLRSLGWAYNDGTWTKQ